MTKGKYDMSTLRIDSRIQYQSKKGKWWEIMNRKPFMSCFYQQDMCRMYYFWNKWFKYETEIGANQIIVRTLTCILFTKFVWNVLELEHAFF